MKLSHSPVSSDVIHVRSGKLHSLMADTFCVPVVLPQLLRYEKLSLDRKNNSAGWPLVTGWNAVVMLAAFSSMLPSVYVSHIYYALKVKKCEWCFLFCSISEQYKCQTISQYVIDT